MAGTANFWLVKTEPSEFSIQDLAASKKRTTCWDGVRNYQARNFMRDEMKVGDRVLIYHSNADPSAIVGTATVVKQGYPDHTSWDPNDKHFDPKSSAASPRWFMVDIQLDEILPRELSLAELREVAALRDMELLRKGSRLSVQPVRKKEFDTIVKLSKK